MQKITANTGMSKTILHLAVWHLLTNVNSMSIEQTIA